MNFKYLRVRGWSEREIAHAQAVFERAQAQRHPRLRTLEHLTFWILLFGFVLGAIIVVLELLPIIVLARIPLALAITFILASCLGLLLVHAMHDLHLERSHQHAGMVLLSCCSMLAIVLVLDRIALRIVPASIPSVALAAAFVIGILFPYLVHWRISHDAA